MELFAKLFSSLLVFVYHCFDRIVIHGYLSGLSRPEQVVYFFRNVTGVPVVDKAVLSKRTGEYRGWVEAFARNHKIPMEWAQKGVRKEDYVRPWLRRMERAGQYGVYFVFQSMEIIASITSRRSPFFTSAFSSAVMLVTEPGIGAPTCPGFAGSAFARAGTAGCSALSRTVTSRGCPFSSKNTVRVPFGCGSQAPEGQRPR
jgi:hypothetical protein